MRFRLIFLDQIMTSPWPACTPTNWSAVANPLPENWCAAGAQLSTVSEISDVLAARQGMRASEPRYRAG